MTAIDTERFAGLPGWELISRGLEDQLTPVLFGAKVGALAGEPRNPYQGSPSDES